jgi:uncharacterized protein
MSLIAKIHAIHRYPIKGLSAEPLYCATLTPGDTVPGDRLYTIENGRSGFDAAAPVYLSKAHFFDADEERNARPLAHGVRSGKPFAHYSIWRARGQRRSLRQEGRAAIKSFFAIVLGTAAQIVSIFWPAAR